MPSRLPSLRGIETFVCVAELLNLRLASERLNVTVSAISHRIRGLEEELDAQLFDRSGRYLRLTAEGQALLNRLGPGLALLEQATSPTRKTPVNPVLRISAPPAFHDQWLLPRLGDFLSGHPGTRIELMSSGRRRSTGCDVSIMPLSTSAVREGATPLADIYVSPVCSPDLLAKFPVRSAEDLLAAPLIDTIPLVRSWQTWFRAAGVAADVPPAALSLDNLAMLRHAAVEGLGFALGAESLVEDLIDQGLLVQPLPVSCQIMPSLGILLNDRGNNRLAHAFADWVRAVMPTNVQSRSTIDAYSETARTDGIG